MKEKAYYSIRTGKNPYTASIHLPMALRLFLNVYNRFDTEGYFQEDLGFHCVDAGFIPGALAQDLEGVLFFALRKEHLYPIRERLDDYSEDDLFDIIEFLHDHCSKPTEREYHCWNNCGWHCSKFDREAGRQEFRDAVNAILELYDPGFELSVDGKVFMIADAGMDSLLEAPVPSLDPDNVEARVEAAHRKFRRHRSTLDERRDAIRDLADVLEFLRPKLKTVLSSKDESDLFNLANNFGIRHHNQEQKTQYDRDIWYSWLFYYYLATIHAATRLIQRTDSTSEQEISS
ncbi:MAG: hypothetical protein PHX79_09265 [Sphaerochaetaceae bacterium]|nr:hypothetical protein [Sphaerochaetaceae bacterium]